MGEPTHSASRSGRAEPRGARYVLTLGLTALGVVYGDIGTSPLYALRECFTGEGHHLVIDEPDVLGVLSLVFWSLLIVITLKYLVYVMRADNDGEGGILALMALALGTDESSWRTFAIVTLGLFGAALLYGDGMITPAISVLSAVEGLEVAAPGLRYGVVPITVLILIGLFWFQHRGTARIGIVFGPIMLVWFTVLGGLGVFHIATRPSVMLALVPTHAVEFFARHGLMGVLVLGAVFLVVTGGEALYADMGHFGARPIRLGWLLVALPCLLLNYLGQGALLLEDPSTVSAPLFHMVPPVLVIPLVVLSTCATVIASQAVISGTYSLTRQATMLGYAPRIRVEHTSHREEGQVYVPSINWALLVAAIALVVIFQESGGLAAAYGIAVSTTMVITTLLAHVVAVRRWGWSPWLVVPLTASLLVVDLAFLFANSMKIADGGWVPLVVGAGVYAMMSTWHRGRALLARRMSERAIAWGDLDEWLREQAPQTVPGTVVYMTGNPERVPPALVENVHHNHVLHERVFFVSVVVSPSPKVAVSSRISLERLPHHDLVRVEGRYGFTEQPNVPHLLELAIGEGVDIDVDHATYVLGRESLFAPDHPPMARWRHRLFAFMSRNAHQAASFFGIPSDRVLEVGGHIEL